MVAYDINVNYNLMKKILNIYIDLIRIYNISMNIEITIYILY